MKNQQHKVKLILKEAIDLVQNDYTELNNIKPSDYTKEEYADICKNAIEENALALQYVDPEYLEKCIYKKICIKAIRSYNDNDENKDEDEDEDEIYELFNSIKINFLTKEDYKDIVIKYQKSVEENYGCFSLSFTFLKLIDDEKACFLGPDLYADVCKAAIIFFVKNLTEVKTNLFEGNKNNHYFDICMEAVTCSSDALSDIEIELLTAEQLKKIVIQALESFD